jgi:alpha-L-fucosidase
MNMNKLLIAALVSFLFIGLTNTGSAKIKVPSYLKKFRNEYQQDPRKTNLEWFKSAKYGMFIHYGLYSLLEKEAWVQLRDTIPVAEYAKLKERITAEKFNAEEITDLAVNGGMKYITITSKHHDGFCLFNTKATDFNSLNSAAHRDLVKELYDACERKGLALFIYYSYGADWHHPYFYPRERGWPNARPPYKTPQPEYQFKEDKDFKKYTEFVHQQLTEILTQYPNVAGIWFDPIMGYYACPELFTIDATYALIRKLSTHALISFKQGANGDEDYSAPERDANAKAGIQKGIAGIVYEKNKNKPKEICNTLQPHAWAYQKSDDGLHRKAGDIIKMREDAKKIGANLLLNIGPKGDGSIPDEDKVSITIAGRRIIK